MADNNPWHSVSLGKDAPKNVTAIIEIPRGSKGKYEIDKESGLLLLDRVLSSSVVYPTNYGFIPQTYCDDKDPLDILVISSVDIYPLALVEAKVIGVMNMVDGGEQDDKIIAVAKNDPFVNHVNDISELPPHIMKEVVQFFKSYKALENKTVEVGAVSGKDVAYKVVEDSIALYNKTFK